MRRTLLLPALLLAFAAVPAALAASTPAAVGATATLSPRAVFFGDRVRAQVDLVVDPNTIDPARLAVETPLGSWSELGATRVETEQVGGLVRRRWSFAIACRASECVPGGAPAVVRLPPAQATLVRRDGSVERLAVPWPQLTVAARTSARAAASPPFVLQTAPPAPHPRVSASLVSALLFAAAALLAAAALGIAALELRRRHPRSRPAVSPYERALALARGAVTRPAADRRRALALLARVAAPRDRALSADLGATAWEQPEPEPERMAELVRRAEQLREPM